MYLTDSDRSPAGGSLPGDVHHARGSGLVHVRQLRFYHAGSLRPAAARRPGQAGRGVRDGHSDAIQQDQG